MSAQAGCHHVLFLIFAIAFGIACTPTAAVTVAGSLGDGPLSPLKGCWRVLWLTQQEALPTGFEMEVADTSVVLRREPPLWPALAALELGVRFFVAATRRTTIRSSSCVPANWMDSLPAMVRAHLVAGGIEVNNCTEFGAIPFSQVGENKTFGGMFDELRTPRLYVNGACTPLPFGFHGYLVEKIKDDESLLTVFIANGTRRCSTTFRMRREIEEVAFSDSYASLSILLVVFATIKFLPRILFGRKVLNIGKCGGHCGRRCSLTAAKREELLRQQAEIIRRMKLEDGRQ
ncbi:hypothetical protein ERJ75_000972100 [Trypanosoma vivax]|nr:hypothetical protein ERJ75_000972100 [Trypanosoma vivax]